MNTLLIFQIFTFHAHLRVLSTHRPLKDPTVIFYNYILVEHRLGCAKNYTLRSTQGKSI